MATTAPAPTPDMTLVDALRPDTCGHVLQVRVVRCILELHCPDAGTRIGAARTTTTPKAAR